MLCFKTEKIYINFIGTIETVHYHHHHHHHVPKGLGVFPVP